MGGGSIIKKILNSFIALGVVHLIGNPDGMITLLDFGELEHDQVGRGETYAIRIINFGETIFRPVARYQQETVKHTRRCT